MTTAIIAACALAARWGMLAMMWMMREPRRDRRSDEDAG
jgi:hypothetical protein